MATGMGVKVDRLVSFTAVSLVGLWVHELHRVPALLGLTPDGDLFMLIIAGVLVYWWLRKHSRGAAATLFGYGAINLLGALLTVLPLPWLPFQPEQTASHYAVHAVYAACQVPLLAASLSAMRRVTLATAR